MKALSEASLFNKALFYLRRYPATVEQMKRVLRRKALRVLRKNPHGLEFAESYIDSVVERLRRAGYLDDEKVASSKVASLRRAGKSTRAIAFKLKAMGVSEADVVRHTASLGEDELSAAVTLARKKRLGPFRPGPLRAAHRPKDLARLARAGFSFDIARKVIDAKDVSDAPAAD